MCCLSDSNSTSVTVSTPLLGPPISREFRRKPRKRWQPSEPPAGRRATESFHRQKNLLSRIAETTEMTSRSYAKHDCGLRQIYQEATVKVAGGLLIGMWGFYSRIGYSEYRLLTEFCD